jgi:hypothetical protein
MSQPEPRITPAEYLALERGASPRIADLNQRLA